MGFLKFSENLYGNLSFASEYPETGVPDGLVPAKITFFGPLKNFHPQKKEPLKNPHSLTFTKR